MKQLITIVSMSLTYRVLSLGILLCKFNAIGNPIDPNPGCQHSISYIPGNINRGTQICGRFAKSWFCGVFLLGKPEL
jgi:hypothetical protein